MPAPAVDPAAPLVLAVAVCDQRREYLVTFPAGLDDVAAAFIADRLQGGAYATGEWGNHAFGEILPADGSPAACHSVWPKVVELLYPLCEHGLSADLCMGPDHYMTREQEIARGWA